MRHFSGRTCRIHQVTNGGLERIPFNGADDLAHDPDTSVFGRDRRVLCSKGVR